MKRLKLAVICCAVAVWSSSATAADPSLKLQGWQLFGSEKLGTSGKSCATCHPDGSSLKGAVGASDDELAETINKCITGPLKGKALDRQSTQMKALLIYTRNLEKPGK